MKKSISLIIFVIIAIIIQISALAVTVTYRTSGGTNGYINLKVTSSRIDFNSTTRFYTFTHQITTGSTIIAPLYSEARNVYTNGYSSWSKSSKTANSIVVSTSMAGGVIGADSYHETDCVAFGYGKTYCNVR